MSDQSDSTTPTVMLVTGMSGAGKTTALKVLEDLGWEPIDNFPIHLLSDLLDTPVPGYRGTYRAPIALGFDSRTRGFDAERIIAEVKRHREERGIAVTMLFLDCSGSELERRYNETRRRHPLAQDRPAESGISEERNIMAPLRRWADYVVDTTPFNTQALGDKLRELFAQKGAGDTTLTIMSFGFARGMPPLADLVFDMRFLRNPHWEDELRPLTGQDAPVADYVRADPAFAEGFQRIMDLLTFLLPYYEKTGKSYVTIAFGCTGGRHRSVFVAEQVAQGLRESGFSPSVAHRNLASRPVDALER